jgi:hypothetical protein
VYRFGVPEPTSKSAISMPLSLDPFSTMRRWVKEWEDLVNQHGAEWLEKPEVAQAMQRMSAARLEVQTATSDGAGKVLAAVNMPSKADIEALGMRLGAIEAALARIEAHQLGIGTPRKQAPSPPRTRKPSAK